MESNDLELKPKEEKALREQIRETLNTELIKYKKSKLFPTVCFKQVINCTYI